MAIKVCGSTVIDDSKNVCANAVTACCIIGESNVTIPSGTTACRPAGATGSLYFDTDQGSLVAHNGTDWTSVGGAGLAFDNIVTSDTDAWTFVEVKNLSNSAQCRCYSESGTYATKQTPFDYNVGTQAVSCLYFAQDISCSYPTTIVPCAYVMGPFAHCTYGLCPCLSTLAPCVCFGAILNCTDSSRSLRFCENPFDGSMIVRGYISCITNPPNYIVCNNTHTLIDYFFNTKGGFSEQKVHRYSCGFTCAAYHFNAGSVLVPRYAGATQYGWVPFSRMPLRYYDKTDPLFTCPTAFFVTSNTFGTGNEEVCDFAVRLQGNCYEDGTHEFAPLTAAWSCMSYCSAYFTCEGETCGMPMCTQFLTTYFNGLDYMTILHSDPEIRGKNALNRDYYDDVRCCYASGLQLSFPHKYAPTCYFGLIEFAGVEACCLRPCKPGAARASITFLSKDGCYIHNLSIRPASNTQSTMCACKVDCSGPTPVCFCSYDRMYSTKIDRINQCLAEHAGFCCLEFTDWECDVMGCVAGTNSFTYYRFCTPIMRLCCCADTLWGGVEESFGCLTKVCSGGTCLEMCNLSTPMDYLWSRVCENKAFIRSCKNSACSMDILVFDCVQDRLTEYHCLNWFDDNQLVLKVSAVFGMKPCCFSANTYADRCWVGGDVTVAGDNAVCACINTITGCATGAISLMMHCLGYSWHWDSLPLGTLDLVRARAGNGVNDQFFNPSNDHIVFIRAIGCPDTLTGYSCCISWVGAICYDINNCCVSKVNTLFPPPLETLQYQKKTYYDCLNDPLTVAPTTYTVRLCCGGFGGIQNPSCTGYMCCGGFRVRTYGGQKFYEDNNCTSLGGIILCHNGLVLGSIISSCNAVANNPDFEYYGSTCTGTLMCGGCCCIGICAGMEGVAISRLPYEKPFECIGWRSEPVLAQMINMFVAPHHCSSIYFPELLAYGSEAHKCLTNCAYFSRNFNFPTTKVYQAAGQNLCGPYGIYDCTTNLRTYKFMKPCCCFASCCCLLTCAPNGTIAVASMENLFCYYTCMNPVGAQPSLYTNIQPCHLNRDETSKRYFRGLFENNYEGVTEKKYYNGGRVEGQYLKMNTGEHPAERLHRWWNEDAICCC